MLITHYSNSCIVSWDDPIQNMNSNWHTIEGFIHLMIYNLIVILFPLFVDLFGISIFGFFFCFISFGLFVFSFYSTQSFSIEIFISQCILKNRWTNERTSKRPTNTGRIYKIGRFHFGVFMCWQGIIHSSGTVANDIAGFGFNSNTASYNSRK